MSVSGLDVRKVLRVSMIASESTIFCLFSLYRINRVFHEDDIKHCTLPSHSLMSAEAAKRLSADWMPSMYVLNSINCGCTEVILSLQRHRE
jgi:hypothetical protein